MISFGLVHRPPRVGGWAGTLPDRRLMSPRYRLPILIARYDQLVRFSEAKRTRCGRSRVDTGPGCGRVRSRAEGAHGAEGKDRCPHSSCGVVARTGGRGSCGPASPAAGGGGSVRTAAQDRPLQGGQLHQPQHACRSHCLAGRDRLHPWSGGAVADAGAGGNLGPRRIRLQSTLERPRADVAGVGCGCSDREHGGRGECCLAHDASEPIGGAALRVAEQHEADKVSG